MRAVARRLESAGVVRNRWVLTALARWRGSDRLVRPGDYRFAGTLSLDDVLAQLRAPTGALQRVTIPEGRTAAEVMALLADAGLGGADVFDCEARSAALLADLDLPDTGVEGYLFPDTYAFARSAPPAEVLRTMVERYREHAGQLTGARAAIGLSEHEAVTLASVIEKETGAAAERPLVASVFHNRLRRGMALQSDPTAVYERRDFRGPVTAADLAVPSAYNTYQHTGLPPGPIANPGTAALAAAVQPASTDYLFFVSRNDGTHQFSATLDEHQRAVARYQRHRAGA